MSVIGVLTAGGDCPGLNAVIRGVVARADEHDSEVLGIRNGWEGLMNGLTVSLDRDHSICVCLFAKYDEHRTMRPEM